MCNNISKNGQFIHLNFNSLLYLTNLDAILTSGPRIQNPFPHCWSLAVEEHFYIVWPILVYFLSNKTAKIYCFFIIPILVFIYSGFICYIYDGEMARKAIYFSTISRMLSLTFGALIAYYEDYFKNENTTIIRWGCIGVGYFFLNYYYFIWTPFTGEIQPLLDQIGGTLFSFGVVLMVFYYSNKNKLKILSTKPMIFLGSISYGMYLYHYVLIYYLGYSERRTQNPISVNEAIFLLFLIIIVPILSFLIIEKPLLRFKDRFRTIATTK